MSCGFYQIGALCWAASKLLAKMKIDDPLDAWPVHGVCGAWGLISVGIFAFDDDDIALAGYATGVHQGYRLGVQLMAAIAIAFWCILNGLVIFGGMNYFKVLRVDQETEEDGLDFTGLFLSNCMFTFWMFQSLSFHPSIVYVDVSIICGCFNHYMNIVYVTNNQNTEESDTLRI